MADEPIGRLFPAGGPVPPEFMIGRTGDVDEIVRRIQEEIHTLLAGPRRIGKTTVCTAACERVREGGTVVIAVEVPERADAGDLLQLLVDRCSRVSLAAGGRRLFRLARPLIEKTLAAEGVPLDLSQIGGEPGALPTRTVLSLPRIVANQMGNPVVLFLDELQRAVDYADGEQVLSDLVDLYSGAGDVVILVDGSHERILDKMLGAPVQFGKLCDRLALDPRIPIYRWREELPDRFALAGLAVESDALGAIVTFGDGRPYATMSAARYAALNARKLGSSTVGIFEAEEGVAEAERHLRDDEP